MLGFLLLYWIGKYFYDLAKEYNKHKWGHAILAIATYYGVMLLVVVIFTLIILIFGIDFDIERNETIVSYSAIPFGLLGAYGLYKFLEQKWKKEYVNPAAEIDSIGTIEE